MGLACASVTVYDVLHGLSFECVMFNLHAVTLWPDFMASPGKHKVTAQLHQCMGKGNKTEHRDSRGDNHCKLNITPVHSRCARKGCTQGRSHMQTCAGTACVSLDSVTS